MDSIIIRKALYRYHQHMFRAAINWKPDPWTLSAAHLVRHVAGDHMWPVDDDDIVSHGAIQSMHVKAHQLALVSAAENLEYLKDRRKLTRIERIEQEAEWKAYVAAFPDAEDPEYEKFCRQQNFLHERTCGASYITGDSWDPYGTDCVKGDGHSPHTRHRAPEPFNGEGVVFWGGGTWIPELGERTEYTDVVWIREPSS